MLTPKKVADNIRQLADDIERGECVAFAFTALYTPQGEYERTTNAVWETPDLTTPPNMLRLLGAHRMTEVRLTRECDVSSIKQRANSPMGSMTPPASTEH